MNCVCGSIVAGRFSKCVPPSIHPLFCIVCEDDERVFQVVVMNKIYVMLCYVFHSYRFIINHDHLESLIDVI